MASRSGNRDEHERRAAAVEHAVAQQLNRSCRRSSAASTGSAAPAAGSSLLALGTAIDLEQRAAMLHERPDPGVHHLRHAQQLHGVSGRRRVEDDQVVARLPLDDQVDHAIEQRHLGQARRGGRHVDLPVGLPDDRRREHPLDVALHARRRSAPPRARRRSRSPRGAAAISRSLGPDLSARRCRRSNAPGRSTPAARAAPAGSPPARTPTSTSSCRRRLCRRRRRPGDRGERSMRRTSTARHEIHENTKKPNAAIFLSVLSCFSSAIVRQIGPKSRRQQHGRAIERRALDPHPAVPLMKLFEQIRIDLEQIQRRRVRHPRRFHEAQQQEESFSSAVCWRRSRS